MSTHHLGRESSVVGEYLADVLTEALILLARLWQWLTLLTGPRFVAAVRADCGVDDAYPADLHAIGVQLVDDREFGLLCGDLVGDTAEFTLEDRVFAETVSLSTHDAWPDAVNLAFAGGAR